VDATNKITYDELSVSNQLVCSSVTMVFGEPLAVVTLLAAHLEGLSVQISQ